MKLRLNTYKNRDKKLKIVIKNKSNEEKNNKEEILTPSNINMPVFVMAPPIHAKFFPNNAWMYELQEDTNINIEKFMFEWYSLYELLSHEGLVLTFPPKPNLQDLVYVNSFLYLPHIKDENICIISRFKANGRKGEEEVAEKFLTDCGYVCYKPPEGYYFEGEPEARYLKDNIYLGAYGERTSKEALEWIEANFGCIILKLGKTGPKNFHGDCIFFPITPNDVIVDIKNVDKKELSKLENYANVIPVDEDIALYGICNSISVGFTVFTADNRDAFNNKEELNIEIKKLDKIAEIASNLGMEVVYVPLTEALKMGALLSCCVARLNYADKYSLLVWNKYNKTMRNYNGN